MDLTFGVTGAGKVGVSFVKAFCAAGLRCAGVYGGAYADKKAKLLGVPLVTPGEMAQRADVIFICVPDRAIAEAAEALAAEAVRGGIDVRGKFAYHVSGSAQCDVLALLAKLGMETGSLHPLQSFAAPRDSLANIGMAVDGTPKSQALANDLARLAGAVPFNVPAEERAAYHAAACFCSNYAVTVMALAQKLLSRWAASEEEAFKLLLPLFNGTANNLQNTDTAGQALTGPIARGDAVTVKAHLAALPQEFLSAYCALGRETVKLAAENGSITPSAAAEMESLLTEATK